MRSTAPKVPDKPSAPPVSAAPVTGSAKDVQPKQETSKKRLPVWLVSLILALCALIVVASCICLLNAFDVIDIPFVDRVLGVSSVKATGQLQDDEDQQSKEDAADIGDKADKPKSAEKSKTKEAAPAAPVAEPAKSNAPAEVAPAAPAAPAATTISEPAKEALPLSAERYYGPLSGLVSVEPFCAAASTTIIEDNVVYSPNNLFDGDVGTSWQEEYPGDGYGEYAVLLFDEPVDLSYFSIYSGNCRSETSFLNNNRPAVVMLDFSDGESVYLYLDDSMEAQTFMMNRPVHTDYVRITIVDIYLSEKWDDTAISEISLFSE